MIFKIEHYRAPAYDELRFASLAEITSFLVDDWSLSPMTPGQFYQSDDMVSGRGWELTHLAYCPVSGAELRIDLHELQVATSSHHALLNFYNIMQSRLADAALRLPQPD